MMSSFQTIRRLALLAAMMAVLPLSAPARAQTTNSIGKSESGLALPRYVSLKSGRVNLRTGPGRDYSVDWMYLKPGLPMEIIQEYDTWRRVRDSEGTEGWVSQSLLSGKRTGIAAPWQKGKPALVSLYGEADEKSPLVASVEPGAVGLVKSCNGGWCQISFDGHEGWMLQEQVWGVYPDETISD